MSTTYCPNKNVKEWILLEKAIGVDLATLVWYKNKGYSLDLTPKGKASTLYNDILNKNMNLGYKGEELILATLREKASYYLEGNNSWLESGIEPELVKKKVFDTTLNTKYQQSSNEGIIASEKTIRDLAARMADRIGMPIRFESDRNKQYKGKIENNTAVVNLAHATLDTPIHEILGHPIIRVIKNNDNPFNFDNSKYLGATIKRNFKTNRYDIISKDIISIIKKCYKASKRIPRL
jgi:hypothetical protein